MLGFAERRFAGSLQDVRAGKGSDSKQVAGRS
jgi:hypothetical protein